ncbi:hypothetical protein QUB80_02110 [Chlorogloeopsis sp. ULAP01]|uniref:hypothetical protein n=1 Tax=Chlorogloeopsis sp. ULAP01 TaxID=3056483 RepID=UPI0025AAC8BC|nr:hypothetical protein [Chlorogloeopsis sp. ULAP01]MDM9379495.1 hypothetical protein [Chlorogloeopsis sp. ULAP01]
MTNTVVLTVEPSSSTMTLTASAGSSTPPHLITANSPHPLLTKHSAPLPTTVTPSPTLGTLGTALKLLRENPLVSS